jgi:hypothetical protein
MAKVEKKSKEEEKWKEDAITFGANPSPRSEDQVIDKMIQVMGFLEGKMKD